MKRILMILLSLITIQITGLLVFAEPSLAKDTATQIPAIMDVSHRVFYNNENGKSYVDARVTNNSDSEKDVLVIIATYSNNKLENVFCFNNTISAGNTKRFHSEYFASYNVDTIKTFVWDSSLSLEPLSNCAVIDDLFDYEYALKMTQDYELYLFDKYGHEIIGYDESRILCYFGNYSGYKVLTMVGFHDEVVVEDDIAGYHFEFPDTRDVFAYKDSKYYTIKEAYEAGFLSKRDIYEIGIIGGYIDIYKYPSPPDNDGYIH